MGHQMTKAQKAQRNKKKAQKRIKTKENEDSLGISRKEVRFGISPKAWLMFKIIGIVAIPVCYILYSPLLIVCMVYEIGMIFLSRMCERNINHTYVKSRHIRIHKFDSILAVIVIIITFASTIISANTKKKAMPSEMGNNVLMRMESFGSCSTGSRSVLKKLSMKLRAPSFGTSSPPPNMPAPGERKKLEVSDLPIEMVFSMAVSSVNTCLVFLVPVSSGITLLLYWRRKKHWDVEMNEMVVDSLPDLDDKELERIFSFGMEEETETTADSVTE